MAYQVDEDGYILDEAGEYVLDSEGELITEEEWDDYDDEDDEDFEDDSAWFQGVAKAYQRLTDKLGREPSNREFRKLIEDAEDRGETDIDKRYEKVMGRPLRAAQDSNSNAEVLAEVADDVEAEQAEAAVEG